MGHPALGLSSLLRDGLGALVADAGGDLLDETECILLLPEVLVQEVDGVILPERLAIRRSPS